MMKSTGRLPAGVIDNPNHEPTIRAGDGNVVLPDEGPKLPTLDLVLALRNVPHPGLSISHCHRRPISGSVPWSGWRPGRVAFGSAPVRRRTSDYYRRKDSRRARYRAHHVQLSKSNSTATTPYFSMKVAVVESLNLPETALNVTT
jgi:hypothetical protein